MAREGRPQGKRPQNTWRFRCLGRASIARKGRSKTNPLGPVAAPLDNTTPTLAAVSELGTSTAGMQHRWRRAWPLVFREGVGSLCRTIQWHTSNRWGFPHCSNRVDRLERKLRPVDSTSGLRSSENLRHLDSPERRGAKGIRATLWSGLSAGPCSGCQQSNRSRRQEAHPN